MVQRQLVARGITDERVLEAMSRVPREFFVPAMEKYAAYSDRALPIECGQTISQPYMVALMTELLELKGTEHVLEIGTGSGYQTAILAELAHDVVSVERHAELSQSAADTLTSLGYSNVRLVVGDGTEGFAPAAPYDAIVVTAAAAECPPALLQQLSEDGVLVIPIGPAMHQDLQRIRKRDLGIAVETYVPCRFVPLISDSDLP
jgi:protein-L-isoaspartate(D-aspartate) O-methyltransferase